MIGIPATVIESNAMTGFCACGHEGVLHVIEEDGKREFLCKKCANLRLGRAPLTPIPTGIRDR